MDPVSLIASVITIAGTVSISLEQVCAFCGAQTEVLSLINEVNDLRLVLDEINHTVQERGQRLDPQEGRTIAINSVLQKTCAELAEADGIIKTDVLRSGTTNGEQKVGRVSWVRHRPKFKRLQVRLKEKRLTLSTLCSSIML
jgi:hypothetical protein